MTAQATVGVYGLGYVGCVSAVCLAALGYRVTGVDVSEDKVNLLREGRSPVVEAGIGDMTMEVVESGALTVTTATRDVVLGSDYSLVCVGTPSTDGGGLSTVFLEQVTAAIGSALRDSDRWHVVAYRSTMLPGTCEKFLIPMLERLSGKRAGIDFGVCVNPEYLREGSSIADFFDPPKTVIGAGDDRTAEAMRALYAPIPVECMVVPTMVAEMSKYVDNSFHALKVGFANEIGSICASVQLDSHEVMRLFLADTKLNIGPTYLQPGFAFGGSCLPKDVRALTYMARRNDVDIPLLGSLLVSNESHLRRALNIIVADGRRRIGVFGLAFKPGTDDLRESPMVELVERLIGKGFSVRIYDSNVSLSKLVGANRVYINERLPHIGDLLTDDVDEVARHGQILVVGSRASDVLEAVHRCAPDQLIVDLVRLPDAAQLRGGAHYRGIAW